MTKTIQFNFFLFSILILGIFGTIANIYYLSAIPSLLAGLFSFYYIFINRNHLEKYQIWLIILFAYCIISTIIYYPKSFLEFGFYRYDANIFISYLPLLLFPFLSLKTNIKKVINYFIIFESIISFLLLILYKINGYNFGKIGDSQIFTGLFLASNAAGGFYSIICCLLIVLCWKHKKDYIYWACLFLNLIFLASTFSRGSIIGLIGGGVFFFFYIVNKNWVSIVLFFGLCVVQLYLISNTYRIYVEELRCSTDPIATMDYFLDNKHGVGLDKVKQKNIQIRLYENWPRGIYCFLHSPIVGTGMGSVNDIPIVLKEGDFIQTNKANDKLFSSAHAHHSIIHIAAELGIVGLTIFVIFIFTLLKKYSSYGKDNALAMGLIMSLLNVIVASLTEHRITTPASILPIVLLSCLLFSKNDKQIIIFES